DGIRYFHVTGVRRVLFRSLIRGPVSKRKAQEPHPTEAVTDHELHAGIAEVVLGLQNQDLEHGHWIERWPTTLAAVAITKPLDQRSEERRVGKDCGDRESSS